MQWYGDDNLTNTNSSDSRVPVQRLGSNREPSLLFKYVLIEIAW